MADHSLGGLLERLYGMPQVGPDWHPFLAAVGDAFRSHAVAFHSHDVLHQQGLIESSVGVDPDLALKFKALSHEHPWYLHGGDQLFRTGMADDKGLLPPKTLYGNRFFCEVLQPMGIEHGLALLLRHDGPAQLTVLSINRGGDGRYFNASEQSLARLLLPHLRTAYLLQQRLGWLDTLARSFRASLDRLDDGVVCLDRRGVIRFANTAAERYAAQGIYHRCIDGRLRLPTHAQSNQVHAYLRATDPPAGPLSMRVHDALGHWIATLKACAVDHVADLHWDEPESGVMLFFSAVQTQMVANHRQHWQCLWGLTPAEADVAQHLAEGRTLGEFAESAGVSINTVRTHLRALLAKTGAKRQSDLVRLLFLSRD